jgi:hypothetical protein
MIDRHGSIPTGGSATCRTCPWLGWESRFGHGLSRARRGPLWHHHTLHGIHPSGKFLAPVVKFYGNFTGSRVSARSQRFKQGREFDPVRDPLRWEQGGPGLRGPPEEIAGHIIGHGTRQTAWHEHRKLCLSSIVDRFPRKWVQSFTFILISWES